MGQTKYMLGPDSAQRPSLFNFWWLGYHWQTSECLSSQGWVTVSPGSAWGVQRGENHIRALSLRWLGAHLQCGLELPSCEALRAIGTTQTIFPSNPFVLTFSSWSSPWCLFQSIAWESEEKKYFKAFWETSHITW